MVIMYIMSYSDHTAHENLVKFNIMARTPRPILKTTTTTTTSQQLSADQTLICSLPFASCSQSQLLQHHALHVHFPPTPHLARMEITHSPNTYDRAPIAVVPNDCAIPDRGCRSYGDGDRKTQSRPRKRPSCTATPGTPGTPGTGKLDRHQRMSMKQIESYFHPRAFELSSSPYGNNSNSNSNTGIDREEGRFEDTDADTIQCHFAALPSPALTTFTTASWTPPLTRSSSPLSSSSLASSSDEPSSVVPVSVHPQSQLRVQQSRLSDGGVDTEETPSPSSVPSALTPLPYLPPSSPKSSKKKKSSATTPSSSSSGGENSSGGRRRRRDLDCLTAYTRWSSPFSDPALDGCLGGF